MVRFLYLGIASLVAFSSVKGYWAAGYNWQSWLGGLIAACIFLFVQKAELQPLAMTDGECDPVSLLKNMVSKGSAKLTLADPEDLHRATINATVAYMVDFALGLIVWPPVPQTELLFLGGVTPWDVSIDNIFKVLLCVFGLQMIMARYLRAGGKLPDFITDEQPTKSN